MAILVCQGARVADEVRMVADLTGGCGEGLLGRDILRDL